MKEISRCAVALEIPGRQRLDVGGLHEPPVLLAQEIFEEDLQGIRQARARRKSRFQYFQAENLDRAAANLNGRLRAKGVYARHQGILKRGIVARATARL